MMATQRTYLDHNATATIRPEARAAMTAALELPGNPSSVHAEGRAAREVIERARDSVAALVHARPAEVFFTSGGTEANNWVLHAGWDTVFMSEMEHDSVLAAARSLSADVHELPAHSDGTCAVEAIADHVLHGGAEPGLTLIALQLANNETGVCQPVNDVVRFAREHDLSVFTDAVQAVGRIPVDAEALDADYLSLSAHKLGGPKGVGALIVRGDTRIGALISGGGQERRMRGGTENVAGIAGFGAAARQALAELPRMETVTALRDRLEHSVRQITPHAVVVGEAADRLANTTCLALAGARAETLVIALDLKGVAVSAGSACSSGKVEESHVLAAMGLGPKLGGSAIRISLGWNTTADDIDAFLRAWTEITATTELTKAA